METRKFFSPHVGARVYIESMRCEGELCFLCNHNYYYHYSVSPMIINIVQSCRGHVDVDVQGAEKPIVQGSGPNTFFFPTPGG